jgi:hypothetical protein
VDDAKQRRLAEAIRALSLIGIGVRIRKYDIHPIDERNGPEGRQI